MPSSGLLHDRWSDAHYDYFFGQSIFDPHSSTPSLVPETTEGSKVIGVIL